MWVQNSLGRDRSSFFGIETDANNWSGKKCVDGKLVPPKNPDQLMWLFYWAGEEANMKR